MIDHVSADQRSAMMRGVRGKHTKPEILVRRAAHRLGLRFRLHNSQLPGRPDIVFPKWRTAIFVNGCFWHRHADCKRTTVPKSNTDFWLQKFAANVARDERNYEAMERLGWTVIILWECELRDSDDAARLLRAHFALP